MGNSQSAEALPCHRSPLCRALCFSSAAPAAKAADDGEWFGELPRGGKSKRRKSSKRKSLSKLPSVPEDSAQESVSSDTVLTSEENGPDSPPTPPPPPPRPSLGKASSDHHVLSKAEAAPAPAAPGRKSQMERALSESMAKSTKKKKKKRQPSAKLTFFRGQFVDPSTDARSGEVATVGIATTVGGIVSSVRSGHSGILATASSPSMDSADGKKTKKANSFGLGAGMRRRNSEASTNSVESETSERTSGSGVTALPSAANNKNAVSFIVALGEGMFLTASKSDRVIKMWKAEKNVAGKPDIHFVRDFSGHHTGVTCLAKVDAKGRFLSASKDHTVKLWDSRFNCDDDDEDLGEFHRRLLATFENVDRRNVHGIAVTDGGSFVRPTDAIDAAMAAAMTKKALMEGSASVTKAAQERQIIECSCEFATISGRHNSVKMWSMTQVNPEEGQLPTDCFNVAEVKVAQELKHDAVVESIAAVEKKGMLLTGDRMGNVKLWTSSGKNLFLPGATSTWSCARTFSWRKKSDLASVEEAVKFAITSLSFLQDNSMFVSGSKSGNLRVWKVDGNKKNGETVKKEVICITGAHTAVVTAVRQGPRVNDDGDDSTLSFSSASEDGKVLSFAIPVAKIGTSNPSCFNVVNHDIANRYVVDVEPIGVTALACLEMPKNAKDILVTGSTNDGSVNLLKRAGPPAGPRGDALLLYRQAMEEESLTLYAIAEEITSSEAVECKNRRLNMTTYKNVFRGKDAVSFLVDSEYAATRDDAVDLGRVLATHLSLFECVTKKCKELNDDSKSYYRWSCDFADIRPNLRKTESEH